MAKTHVNFKLSEDVMNILHTYQKEQHLDMLTEALESILREFWKNRQRPVNRFKRLINIKYNEPDPKTKPLEVFTSAQES